VISLLGIPHPKECAPGYDRATCTPMFAATLLTIAKLCKQLSYPTMKGLNKCSIYIHNGVLYSLKE
jgi:hypothetical protein